jgi:uncharacterized protein (DUF302 family)
MTLQEVREQEAQMYYFSRFVNMNFEDAVAATKEALQRHRFSILAEIDMRKALKEHLAVDFRPYLIISAYNPQLADRAIRADEEIGSILLCNVVVHQQADGGVEISVTDPAASIGTINNVELISVARDLRFLVQQAMDDIECEPEARPSSVSERRLAAS